MKFSENSLVVDVIKISNSSYKLSVPAGDLLTAAMNGAVLRRHDLSTAAVPNVLYVPLSEAKLSSGTYTFTFASGDAFTASAADAYPAASSVSDKTDSELPAVETTDKDKYLHTNESTGAVEWADAPNELPAVAAVDDGKVLTANSGVWGAQEPIGKKFIVTLTPTAQDFSGTMDKTVAEINAAYEAGQEIWFEISDGTTTARILVDGVGYNSDTYPSFETKFIGNGNIFIRIFTGMTNDGTKQTYSTAIYALTPAT